MVVFLDGFDDKCGHANFPYPIRRRVCERLCQRLQTAFLPLFHNMCAPFKLSLSLSVPAQPSSALLEGAQLTRLLRPHIIPTFIPTFPHTAVSLPLWRCMQHDDRRRRLIPYLIPPQCGACHARNAEGWIPSANDVGFRRRDPVSQKENSVAVLCVPARRIPRSLYACHRPKTTRTSQPSFTSPSSQRQSFRIKRRSWT